MIRPLCHKLPSPPLPERDPGARFWPQEQIDDVYGDSRDVSEAGMARLKALTDSLKSVVWEGRVKFTEADLLAEVNNTPVDAQKILEHVFGPDGLDRDPSKFRALTDEGGRLPLIPSPACVWGFGGITVEVMYEQTGGGPKKVVDDDEEAPPRPPVGLPPPPPVGLPKQKKRPYSVPLCEPLSPSLAAAATPAAHIAHSKKAKVAAKGAAKGTAKGAAEAEVLRARGDADAAAVRAEGHRAAAELLSSNEVAVRLAQIDRP